LIIRKIHILFLFSDTGGGHRSAAEAIIEALNLEYPDEFTYEMVDFFADYSPPPLNLAGPTYPAMSRMDDLWKLGFDSTDDPVRMRRIYAALWPSMRLYMYKLIRTHPCDVIVSVHPLINTPFLRAKKNKGNTTPYITVVLDLVSTHCAWFNAQADLIVVPSRQAYQNALNLGIKPEKLKMIGLPVADRFCHPIKDKKALRRKLGWPEDKFTILLAGGGDGLGPLGEVSTKVNDAKLDATMVVVAGATLTCKTSWRESSGTGPLTSTVSSRICLN
jgi:1,2-diacylglycerol 3-beta-galactosyltransferase